MNWNKFFNYSRTIFWIGLILMLYIFVVLVDENTKNYKLRQKEAQLVAQNEQLQSDIQNLKFKIDYYASDNYKELVARQELGLQAPGEQVVVVPRANGAPSSNNSTKITTKPKPLPKSDFQQWIDFFNGTRT